MRRSAILLGLVFLGACAGRSAAPVPTMTAYDNNLSCEQIQAEIQSNEAKARQLIDEDNSNRNANIAIGTVGVLLFWPALFALDLSDAERVEAGALHERNTHLASLSRDCSGVGSTGGIQSARAIRHGAYDGKWTAESPEEACGLPWAMQIEVRNGKAEGMLWRGKLAYNFAGSIAAAIRLRSDARASGRRAPMTHYIAILIPSAIGEWRVVFPDLPGCETKGSSFVDAKSAAMSALPRFIKNIGLPISGPRDMSEIKRDTEWLEQNGVDLSKAVITLVPLAA